MEVREKIEGQVKNIVYRNEESGWTVFNLLSNHEEYKVTGIIPAIEKDDFLTIQGKKEKNKYGEQIKAEFILKILPQNAKDIKKYLIKNIQGVGEKTADKILEKYGKDTFTILSEHPEELQNISKINKRKALKIAEQFKILSIDRDKQMFYLQIGLTNAQINSIEKKYESKAMEIIQTNPYQLIKDIKGIGFKKADDIGFKFGIKKDSHYRVKAALIYFLEQFATLEGHIYYNYDEFIEYATKELDIDSEIIEECVKSLILSKEVENVNSNIYLSRLYHMECNIAKKITKMANNANSQNNDFLENQKRLLYNIEKENNRELDETQRAAVMMALNNKISIITGGPGVGKTTTLDIFIKYLQKYETDNIILLAPTGRAAKRMSEQTGMESSTIHRMCGTETMDEIDADVIVVDEMSMVDIYVMNMLLEKIPDECKLVMVGDVDQLPSVGPGLILKDMINSGIIKTSKLTVIHRQATENHIVTNAHKINDGDGKSIKLNSDNEDFFFLKRESIEECVETIMYLYTKAFPKYKGMKPTDVQILTPTKKGELGTVNLNKIIQEKINPKDSKKKELKRYDDVYREGDKVMHIKNNYNMEWKVYEDDNLVNSGYGIFNGDTGYIISVDTNEKTLVVKFEDGKQSEYCMEELDELVLAYAITVHKSQGSEYPCVILPLFYSFGDLFNKNLLYTAITRAKNNMAIIGKTDVFYKMIKNKNADKRHTSLQELIEYYAYDN